MFRTTLDIHRAKIHKIYEPMPFNKGEVKFFSFVTADNHASFPAIDRLMGVQDTAAIMGELKPAIAQVADRIWESALIRNIRKRHTFQFGDTGRALLNYQSDTPPTEVHWLMLVVEIDQDVRDIGRQVVSVMDNEQLEDIAKALALLAATPYGSTAMAAFTVSTFIMKGIGKLMKKNKNDQVGYIDQSFLIGDDYGVGVDQARTGSLVSDLTGNMWYDYTLTVRRMDELTLADATRETNGQFLTT